MRLLALDFDGVLSDSAPEAFVVALRTFGEMRPATALAGAIAGVLGRSAPSREQVLAHPLYPAFVDLMPLGNRAEDYAVILTAIEAGAPLPDQSAYDAWRDRQGRDWLRSFHKSFYRVRTALSESDPPGWGALMGPYPPLPAALRRHAGEIDLAIATAKDRRSVGKLLHAYGIADLFPEGRVLDKETGVSKAEHLAHLHDLLGIPYAEMTFLEDKVNHLDAAARLGVRCALAAWGYNGEREIRQARARGYLVCTLDDFERQLFTSAAVG
ncbi:MAG: HAD family hydrolase [Myxococcales bacterium]|nr:MAG: HAD family hydrolase [Myxococcales bacterium]